MLQLLERLRLVFASCDRAAADWLGEVINQAACNEEDLWVALNSNEFWGGAGSLADKTMDEYPQFAAEARKLQVREMREVMIEIGHLLIDRGNENPRTMDWVLAFSNWNASDV